MSSFNPNKYRAVPTPDLPDRQWPNRRLTQAPIWASVDLRDGNQALATPMTVEQKLTLWHTLVDIGFKTIEIGFPSASQPEFEFVRRLIEEDRIPDDVTVQVLVQAREHLIARTYEALQGVKRAVVHVYNTTSTLQRERVFEKSRDEIKAIAVQGATWVKDYAARYPQTDWVFQYSPESFSQTETDYAVEVCQAVMDVWRPTPQNRCILNLPATVEVTSPNRFADQIEYFIRHLPNREAAIISVHTHNDRGCAVAAAELALLAGADRVEGTLLGNGERTGNMDIVTLAMNLYSEGIDPQLDLSDPGRWIPTLEDITRIPTHMRHPWVGEAVYTAYSGSHQDAIRKSLLKQKPDEPWQVAYLPIDPADLHRSYEAIIRVNSQSGKAGAAFVLQDYGLQLPKWVQQDFAPTAQLLAEQQGGVVSSAELHRVFCEQYDLNFERTPIHYQSIDTESELKQWTFEIINHQAWSGQGKGLLSGLCDAWQRQSGRNVEILDYSEHAIFQGKDAKAIAYVWLEVDGERHVGVASMDDSAQAMVWAILSVLGS
jgi:2-isopropylmalate synthase